MRSMAATFLGHILIRIVHGVKDAVGAYDRARKHDRRLPSHAARGVVDVLAHVIADFPFERLEAFVALGRNLGPMHEIKPELPERQSLAEVTKHPLCLRNK